MRVIELELAPVALKNVLLVLLDEVLGILKLDVNLKIEKHSD
jgi:hypothetical protein